MDSDTECGLLVVHDFQVPAIRALVREGLAGRDRVSIVHIYADDDYGRIEARHSNLLDGAAPFYRCYETKDSKFMAV